MTGTVPRASTCSAYLSRTNTVILFYQCFVSYWPYFTPILTKEIRLLLSHKFIGWIWIKSIEQMYSLCLKDSPLMAREFTMSQPELGKRETPVVSNSLRLHGLQPTRLPCPTPNSGAYSNSCQSIRWCHPTISPSVIPFSSCLQYFPESGSFPMSHFFPSGGQCIGVSASASVGLPWWLRW